MAARRGHVAGPPETSTNDWWGGGRGPPAPNNCLDKYTGPSLERGFNLSPHRMFVNWWVHFTSVVGKMRTVVVANMQIKVSLDIFPLANKNTKIKNSF